MSIVISDCYFPVLPVPIKWQDPVVIKDNNNNDDDQLNYKATVYLVPSVLHILILKEKVLLSSTLQIKKLRLKGFK